MEEAAGNARDVFCAHAPDRRQLIGRLTSCAPRRADLHHALEREDGSEGYVGHATLPEGERIPRVWDIHGRRRVEQAESRDRPDSRTRLATGQCVAPDK
jgi:hypothetical protein